MTSWLAWQWHQYQTFEITRCFADHREGDADSGFPRSGPGPELSLRHLTKRTPDQRWKPSSMPPQSSLNLLVPRFPLELERKIFESAALARPMSIPHLMLVAWRVREWVGPLLYRVVFLCSPSPMRKSHSSAFGLPTFTEDALQQRPTTCFRRAKHLFIGFKVDPSAVESWLPACSGVTNLFAQISYPTKMLHVLSVLCSVRHLTIDIRALSRADGPCPLFHSVTHLELFELYNIGSEPEDGADRLSDNLALIPHLTHIAFNPKLHEMVSHAALAADTRLQCIAFLVSAPYTLKKTSPLLEDDRFVCVQQNLDYRLDWLRGAVTGDDYWAFAEAFIAARRAGRADRSRYNVSDRHMSWKI